MYICLDLDLLVGKHPIGEEAAGIINDSYSWFLKQCLSLRDLAALVGPLMGAI